MSGRQPTLGPLRALTGGEWATVPELLAARVRATPDAPFLIKGERRWSYRQGWAESLRFAGFLVAQGLAGRRVASFLPKSPELLWAWFGSNAVGGSFVALNHAQRGEPLTDLVMRAKAPVLLTDRASFALLPTEAQAAVELVVFVDGVPAGRPDAQRCIDWSAVENAASAEPVPIDPSQPAVMIYTSGTTGRSKAVLLPHAMYTRGAARMVDAFGYRADDVFHDWMPLSHVGGQLHITLCCIVAGGTLAQYESFSRHRFWDEVRATGATLCSGFANILYLLMLPPPQDSDSATTLRLGMVGNIAPELRAAFERRFGIELIDTYGMSECEPLTLPIVGEPLPAGTCGRINPDFEVAIVDPASDRPVPVGSVGRIVVRPRVPHVMMLGYEDDPAATVAAWRNLWFHTQDLGRFDAAGFLYFVDRLKNAIRRGGENIVAVEVERVLKTHPGVVDCGVIGVVDPVVGQEVKAVIVHRPGVTVDPADIHDFAQEHMAAYMVPRFIEFRERLDYTEVGKVKHETLVEATGPVWDARQSG